MAKAPPAFQFYPGDFLVGTNHLSLEAVGAYIRLLCYQWSHDGLPGLSNACLLARFCGVSEPEFGRIWPEIEDKFEADSAGKLFNPRLLAIKAEQAELRLKRKNAGSKGGASSRKQTSSKSEAKAKQTPKQNPSKGRLKVEDRRLKVEDRRLKVEDRKLNTEASDLFEEFWKAFPPGRKGGKKEARKAWVLAIRDTDLAVIFGAALEYAESDVGQGEFVKSPAAWLNQGCWDDDRAAWRNKTKPMAGLSNGQQTLVNAKGFIDGDG